MQIRTIDRSQILSEAANKNTIKVKNHTSSTEIIIVEDEGRIECYKAIHTSPITGETIAVRTPDAGGINSASASVFCEVFLSYRQIDDIQSTLKEFPELSADKVEGYILGAIRQVERHKKINSNDVRILTHLLAYNKKESDLVTAGICTHTDIKRAYCEFTNEYAWCYGFKKPCVDHRISRIGKGERNFVYTPDSFASEHGIRVEGLWHLIRTTMRAAASLGLASEQYCEQTANRIIRGKSVSPQDKEELAALTEAIASYVHNKEKQIYSAYAAELIEKEKTHVTELMDLSVEQGIDYWKLSRAMRNLGVVPTRRVRRRDI